MTHEEIIEELVEIEVYIVQEKPIPRSKVYVIRVNDEKFHVHKDELSGKEILILSGKDAEHFLLLERLHDGEEKHISPEEVVHLRHRRVERFFTVHKEKRIEFFVSDDPFFTEKRKLTADEVLRISGREPSEYYLVKLEGHHQKSYKGKGNEEIHMRECLKFVAIACGPTPLS